MRDPVSGVRHAEDLPAHPGDRVPSDVVGDAVVRRELGEGLYGIVADRVIRTQVRVRRCSDLWGTLLLPDRLAASNRSRLP